MPIDRRAPVRRFASVLALTLALCALSMLASPRNAHAQVFSEELRAKGIWPDLQLTGGAGFGLGDSLGTAVFGRFGAGVLLAYEPLILTVDFTGELGALARGGWGGQLELDHFSGLWAQLGFARVRGDEWMSHAQIGYAEIGLEWQSRFSDKEKPSDALLVVLRLPLGIWSFLLFDDAQRTAREKARAKPTPAPSAPADDAPAPSAPADDAPAPAAPVSTPVAAP